MPDDHPTDAGPVNVYPEVSCNVVSGEFLLPQIPVLSPPEMTLLHDKSSLDEEFRVINANSNHHPH